MGDTAPVPGALAASRAPPRGAGLRPPNFSDSSGCGAVFESLSVLLAVSGLAVSRRSSVSTSADTSLAAHKTQNARPEWAARLPSENENQFAKKIDSISLRTFSSVCARAIAISFTISVRAVSSMRRSPKDSCLLALRR